MRTIYVNPAERTTIILEPSPFIHARFFSDFVKSRREKYGDAFVHVISWMGSGEDAALKRARQAGYRITKDEFREKLALFMCDWVSTLLDEINQNPPTNKEA